MLLCRAVLKPFTLPFVAMSSSPEQMPADQLTKEQWDEMWANFVAKQDDNWLCSVRPAFVNCVLHSCHMNVVPLAQGTKREGVVQGGLFILMMQFCLDIGFMLGISLDSPWEEADKKTAMYAKEVRHVFGYSVNCMHESKLILWSMVSLVLQEAWDDCWERAVVMNSECWQNSVHSSLKTLQADYHAGPLDNTVLLWF